MSIVERAKEFATKAHKGQVRKFTGEPYINHPYRVAKLVEKFNGCNTDLIVSAYLHDTIEDCDKVYSDIVDNFGEVIAAIVWELTKHHTKEVYPKLNRTQRHRSEIIRLFCSSWSARMIKLADRYDNISDFRRNDPSWGSDHYYIAETLELVGAIGNVCPELADNIRRICE